MELPSQIESALLVQYGTGVLAPETVLAHPTEPVEHVGVIPGIFFCKPFIHIGVPPMQIGPPTVHVGMSSWAVGALL